MARSKALMDELRHCRSRVDSARTFRKKEGYDELWQRLADLYRGKHFPEGMGDEDRIAVNIAFATINVIGPSVAVNHPKITVLARKPEEDDQAVIIETLVNYWWRTHEFRPEFRRAVKDFLIFGFGWLKTGYRFVEEAVDRPDEDVQGELDELRGEADAFAADNPDLAGDLPTDDEIAANVATTEMRVVEDRPFVERVSIYDMFVDPEATSMEDLRWIAQRHVRDVDEAKKDERYKKSTRDKLEADSVLDEKYRPAAMRDKDREAKRVTIWEFYDIKRGTMCVFTEKGDDYLVEPMEQPYAFGHPFVMMRNYEVPDTFYPMGELEAIEPLQQELNKTRSQMMNHRKRGGRKYLYDPRAFSRSAVGMLESERDGVMVPVNEGVPLDAAMLPVPQVNVDAQLYQASEVVENDINNISGISEYMRGGQSELRRTATEAALISDAANARAADKLALIEDGISQIARRVIMLAQQYMTEPQVVRVIGNDSNPLWAEVEPEWIRGEYDFDVEGGSTQPQNEMMRRQSAMQLLQVLSPFLDPQLGLVNAPELLKHVLRDGFGIKDPAKFLGGGPMAPQQDMFGAPIGMAEEDMMGEPPEEDASMDEFAGGGQSGVDPNILAQLQGQVGLTL